MVAEARRCALREGATARWAHAAPISWRTLPMWQHLTPLRKRVQSGRIPARRPQRYRPHCTTLEDRCLLSVSLTPSVSPAPLVGAPVTWTATSSGHGSAPVYQFSVGPAGALQMVRDFSTSASFSWNPMQEGTYDVRVTAKDSFA